jgi:hypothetical protein
MVTLASLARREVSGRIDSGLRSIVLLERGKWVRQVVDLAIGGMEVEAIPSCLGEGQGAILVSNYPSVASTLRAVMKVGCRLPGEDLRLKAIARPEVVTGANAALKALGIGKFVFPVQKSEDGAYRMDRPVLRQVLSHLNGRGNVLWLSITGRTRGNGLLEEDLRTGAALFSVKTTIPLVPMGLVTRARRGKPSVVKVRFGEPIQPPGATEMGDFEKSDYLFDLSRLAMCQVARLLPPGQRGDLENADEKLAETERRLMACRQESL